MKAIFFIFGIIAILIVSGCTQNINSSNPLCSPDYVKVGPIGAVKGTAGVWTSFEISSDDAKDRCKTGCYNAYQLTSYKITIETVNDTTILKKVYQEYYCYCDTKNCGGQILENK